jgi:hypothetical protein
MRAWDGGGGSSCGCGCGSGSGCGCGCGRSTGLRSSAGLKNDGEVPVPGGPLGARHSEGPRAGGLARGGRVHGLYSTQLSGGGVGVAVGRCAAGGMCGVAHGVGDGSCETVRESTAVLSRSGARVGGGGGGGGGGGQGLVAPGWVHKSMLNTLVVLLRVKLPPQSTVARYEGRQRLFGGTPKAEHIAPVCATLPLRASCTL